MVGYLGSLRGLGRGSSVTGWVLLALTRKLLSLTQALFIMCVLGQVINLPMPQFLIGKIGIIVVNTSRSSA